MLGTMSDMKIKATRITFTFNSDSSRWATEEDLRPWMETLERISEDFKLSKHFSMRRTGFRYFHNMEDGGAIKEVVLNVPLPKSEINRAVREAIFSIGAIAPTSVSVENYTIDADEFGVDNKTNLNGAHTVKADS